MELLSVNIAKLKPIQWQGKEVLTGIFKKPVEGAVKVVKHTLVGDEQGDLGVHGGPNKAVYAYAFEHYDWWAQNWPNMEFGPGVFGENLTTRGLDENTVCVGDVFQVGGAVLQAVQPRSPCFKLGVKFNDQNIVKKFTQSGRWGIYFRVVQEGFIQKGDAIKVVSRDPKKFPLQDVVRQKLTKQAGGKI